MDVTCNGFDVLFIKCGSVVSRAKETDIINTCMFCEDLEM